MHFNRVELSEEEIRDIKSQVQKLKSEYNTINPIIRDQVFSILESKCVVLYFPIQDEIANACYIPRHNYDGSEIKFVFIDTSKPLEKQVFAAAHELAHILKVSDSQGETLSDADLNDKQETIANRFAAELLINEDVFRKYMKENLSKTFLIDTIIKLMDIFLVPYKSIVYRFEEIFNMDSEAINQLIEFDDKNHDLILLRQQTLSLCTNNNIISGTKKFGNFIEIVKKLYEKNMITQSKYKYYLSLFEVNIDAAFNKSNDELNELFQVLDKSKKEFLHDEKV